MEKEALTPVLDANMAQKIDAYWRAANFLSVARFICAITPC